MKTLNGTEYTPIEIDGITEISLEDLFTLEHDDLPEFVDTKCLIYLITCIPNGKVYVGLTKQSLYYRFVMGSISHYESMDDGCKIHNAFYKYGYNAFKVEILEILEDPDDLEDREWYWIDMMESFWPLDEYGYNMTSGGDSGDQLHTPEVYETQRRNHGGVLACQTPEAYENNRRNHGGVLSCHTPESYETNRKNHGGVLSFNTPEAHAKAIETRRREGTFYADQLQTNKVYAGRMYDNILISLQVGLYVNKKFNLGLTNPFEIYLSHWDDNQWTLVRNNIKNIVARYDDILAYEQEYGEDHIFYDLFQDIVIKDNFDATIERVEKIWQSLL